jgi:1,4-dihydroxy-2-naphthoate octaprenyltransferase
MTRPADLFKNLIRALRLPFASASVVPFVFGSLIDRSAFNLPGFLLGFTACLSAHLSANLINDYADSRSSVDWQDTRFFGFFGGSKLIQENIFSEDFYLLLAIASACLSAICVLFLAVLLKNPAVLGYFAAVIALAWAYSMKPLQLSYHRLGEFVIFLLFGPAAVMGGYFIQTGIFPDLKSFLLSLPFGFLTTAILFSNEVPDLAGDVRAGKRTWVSLAGGPRAYLVYGVLIFAGFSAIVAGVEWGYLRPVALSALVLVIPAVGAAKIIKEYHQDKVQMIGSSKATIAIQTVAGLMLILGLIV